MFCLFAASGSLLLVAEGTALVGMGLRMFLVWWAAQDLNWGVVAVSDESPSQSMRERRAFGWADVWRAVDVRQDEKGT